MSGRKIIFGTMICLLIAVFVGESLSQIRRYNRRRNPVQNLNRRRAAEQRQMQREHEKRKKEFEQRAAERKERRLLKEEEEPKQIRKLVRVRTEASIKQVLGATAEQWGNIEPKFKKVQALLRVSRISIAPVSYTTAGGAAGGEGTPLKETNTEGARSENRAGWKWLKPSVEKGPGNVTKGEKTCEELASVLQDVGASEDAIIQKVQAVRNIREQAVKQLAEAREELRKVVTARQEATLVLMGWLD